MGNPRDINLDIVGHDKTDRATRSAARNLDRLKRKTDEASKSSGRLSAKAQVGIRAIERSALALGKMAGAAAAAGAVLPAAAIATAKLALAARNLLLQIGPAAAAMLPLAAGAALVRATIVSAGPAMLKAIEPVTKAWEKQQERVGELAARGLPKLSREFVRVNFPAIAAAQDRIARAMNRTVLDVGRWVNSAEGQKTVSRITKDTADTFERLAPRVSEVVRAAGRLAGRASSQGFRNFGDAADWALRKTTELLNKISAKDVETAFTTIKDLGEKAGRGLRKIGDGLAWIEKHRKTIDAVRTALAVLAIVVGVATGGWLIALGGVIALVTIYWDRLKAALQRARDWFQRLVQQSPATQDAILRIRDGVRRLWDGIQGFIRNAAPGFRDFFRRVGPLIQAVMPYIGRFTQAAGRILQAWLPVLGRIVGAMASFAGSVIGKITSVLNGFRSFSGRVAGALAGAIAAVRNVASRIRSALDSIPSLKEIVIRVSAPGAGFVKGLLSGLPGFSTGAGLTTRALAPSFATGDGLMTGALGGPVTVNTGPVSVDSRVFLDGRQIAAVARSTVHDEQSRAAFRARYGRRVQVR